MARLTQRVFAVELDVTAITVSRHLAPSVYFRLSFLIVLSRYFTFARCYAILCPRATLKNASSSEVAAIRCSF